MSIDFDSLLAPNRIRFSLMTVFLFLLYLLLVAIGVAHHEPWLDEVHPWMMAQDEGWKVIFFERLHWDAHPGLWYFLLKVWTLVFPGNGLSAMAFLFGVWNAALYLFYSRLPIWIRIGFAFSYFFFYQNPIVARSYVLYPILFWGLMRIWDERLSRPWIVGSLLALIASVSLHGIVFGAGAILGMILEIWSKEKRWRLNREIGITILIYGSATLFWIYCLFPSLQPLDRGKESPFSRIEALLTLFTASPWITVVIIGFLFALYIQIKGRWSLLMPVLFLLGMFIGIYYAPWHEGILYGWGSVLVVRYFPEIDRCSGWMKRVIVALLVLIFLVQLKWSSSAWIADYRGAFSGSKEAAMTIRDRGWEKEGIEGYGHFVVTLNAYFPKNIFMNRENFNKRYYSWNYPIDLAAPLNQSDLGRFPTIVVHQSDEASEPVRIHGYQWIRRCQGKVYWKDTFSLEDNYDLYRRVELSQ